MVAVAATVVISETVACETSCMAVDVLPERVVWEDIVAPAVPAAAAPMPTSIGATAAAVEMTEAGGSCKASIAKE